MNKFCIFSLFVMSSVLLLTEAVRSKRRKNHYVFQGISKKEIDELKDGADKLYILNDGNKIPAVGYGTWQSSGSNLEMALHAALKAGYRHIDTATAYSNEHIIGKVLEEWFKSGKLKREDVYITTKLPQCGNRATSVRKYLKKSLQDLKLDYVDMYLIHGPFGVVEGNEFFPKDEQGQLKLDYSTDHISLWKAMEDQVYAGLTKSIGISNFNRSQIQRILDNSRIPPANLQVELNIPFQQKPLVEYCKKNKIVVTSYSSLGSPSAVKHFGKTEPSVMENPDIMKIAKKYGKSPAQIILRFIVQQGIVVIPKSLNEKRIAENFKVLDFEIDDKDMQTIKGLDKGEEGRLWPLQEILPGVEKHPEYPFPILNKKCSVGKTKTQTETKTEKKTKKTETEMEKPKLKPKLKLKCENRKPKTDN